MRHRERLASVARDARWILVGARALRRARDLLRRMEVPAARAELAASLGDDPAFRLPAGMSAERIGRVVRRGRYLAPRASSCLPMALAAEALLRRAGYEPTLHIGVLRPENGAIQAHAWVENERVAIVGGGDLRRFHELRPSSDRGPR